MARTESKMLPLGTTAPNFKLPDTDGRTVSLDSFPDAKAYLVIFMCNHCPFVKHLTTQLASTTSDLISKGVAVFGINSNDVVNYPDDRPELMAKEKQTHNYKFPYLYDESQQVAKAYDAACTPDFYLFDRNKKLVYRGQFDDSRPGNGIPVTGKDLMSAASALLAGQKVSDQQRPSIGCNIKWKTH